MAMVLSSQSRLLVALCFTMLVLAGALAVGSFAGWFQPGYPSDPVPAKLRQVDRNKFHINLNFVIVYWSVVNLTGVYVPCMFLFNENSVEKIK